MQNVDKNIKAVEFKDKALEKDFNKYGFIIVPNFIQNDSVKKLFKLFNNVYDGLNTTNNQWNSLFDLNVDRGNEISDIIKEEIKESMCEIFEEFEFPTATFMCKNPLKNSTCELHRDFSIADEEKTQFRNIWIPLIDIDRNNGALYVIPGSHRFFTDIRPMFSDWAYTHLTDEIMKMNITVYPKAGDLVVYSDRTLHGSWENKSNLPRPVIHGGILPPNAPLCYYHFDNPNIKKIQVNKNFFIDRDFMHMDKILNNKEIGQIRFKPKGIDFIKLKQEIKPLLKDF